MMLKTPILTCQEASEFEGELLGSDLGKIRAAMGLVGDGLGAAIVRDFSEVGVFPERAKILLLLGKGHNAGDAVLGAKVIKKVYSGVSIDVCFCLGREGLKPLVLEALEGLGVYREVTVDEVLSSSYDVSIDGVLGMSFKPPLRSGLLNLFEKINGHEGIRFRAAVDMPSGMGLRADFTYATGVAKAPIFDLSYLGVVGRIRFLDIGFFDEGYEGPHETGEYLLGDGVLDDYRRLRSVDTYKRDYGHLLVLAGSKRYPGALMMSVKAALKAGVGLVTAFAPESLVSEYAAVVPECMWVPWPEVGSEGGLSYEGKELLADVVMQGSALLVGPGMGDHDEVGRLLRYIAVEVRLPIVMDASALKASVFDAMSERPEGFGGIIATPHVGEYQRIAGGVSLYEWWEQSHVTTLLKGPVSKIVHDGVIYNSTYGGPVLARGGSGDILAGMVGALLAQSPDDCLGALSQAVVWHGRAADLLAQSVGQVSTRTTELYDYLESVIRNPE